MINFLTKAANRGVNVKKLTTYAIVVNAVQIGAALLVAVYALLSDRFQLNAFWEKLLVCALALVVIWGAFLDIRDAYSTREIARTRRMLEDSNRQLEALNGQLRAQRHDFMNHIQVIYSLTEMEDQTSALDYMDTLYQDLQKVSRALKTASPALNALISAKMADCEEQRIAFTADVRSDWNNSPVPAWEMCRVLGNLIDNAVEAVAEQKEPTVTLRLWEDVRGCHFSVSNSGAPIPEELREKIFETGFSTKREGRGMGLHIVQDIVTRHGGTVSLDADSPVTCFHGVLPRKA